VTARSTLWAPWRAEYLERPTSDRCIFCEPEAPVPDRERLILYRGDRIFVLLNRYPYTTGHVMVAPYEHVARLAELGDEVQEELIHGLTLSERILEKAFDPDGLNIGANLGAAAGAGYADHLHLHVVPRWRGDTNFMTAIADARVVPKALERTYDELAPLFAEYTS
jgi:ATP adenylyltransferase